MLMILPVQAQETGASCATVAEDAARLACYDSLFRATASVLEEGALRIESERLIPAVPTGRQPAEMVVACDAGTLVVRFRFAGQQVSASANIAPITFQVDQNATVVRTLAASADNTEVGFWTSRESGAFLDTLAGGTNLRVRMTPVRMRSLTVDFRIAEQSAAITAVRESCA